MPNSTDAEIRAKLRSVYKGIKRRCYNPHEAIYKYYGGKGIVCEWLSFQDFFDDMGVDYKIGLTIERTNSNGNYSKENCRWATRKEQARNTSRNRHITFAGKRLILAEWAEITGIKSTTIRQRLDAYNWPVEKALQR